MIEVTVHRQNEKITSFTISGHANSGPYGYDLVCAAVSAVSFGAVNAVFELCNIDLLINQADDGGFLRVTVPNDISAHTKEQVELIFKAMIISLQTIERDYGQHIVIKE